MLKEYHNFYPSYGLSLNNVVTEKIDIIDFNYDNRYVIKKYLNYKLAPYNDFKDIIIYNNTSFETNNNKFFELDMACYYHIEPAALRAVFNTNKKRLVLPPEALLFLLRSSIDMSKVILNIKTKDTYFQKLSIPEIAVKELRDRGSWFYNTNNESTEFYTLSLHGVSINTIEENAQEYTKEYRNYLNENFSKLF